ncbi:MAG: AarF/UbiB family protein [Acidobacteriota bacterium]
MGTSSAAAAVFDPIPEDLGGLLPGDTARFAPLVRAALVEFLERLPAEAQLQIVTRQAALPPTAPVALRLFALLHSSPTLHKLGQVVARDERLHDDLRVMLQRLESMPASASVDEIQKTVREELAADERDSIALGNEILAEASVAAVLPFRWHLPRNETVDGVFKVLKPGVAERLEAELILLPDLGEFLEAESRRLDLPTPDYSDAFEQVRSLLSREILLEVEQANLRQMAAELASLDDVEVPETLSLSTPRMTAMTRLRGVKVTEGEADRSTRRRLAKTAAEALVVRPLLAPRGEATFHADPHAGNLMQTDDGRLGILDWALTGSLQKSERVDISRLVIATLNLDAGRLARIVERLADAPLDRAAALLPIRTALGGLRLGDIPTLSSVFSMLDDVATEASVRFGGNLILFRKSLHSVQGVLRDLDPDFSLDAYVIQRTIEQALRDLPRRWISGPFNNKYGTHLSNFDVARLMTSGPGTLMRLLRRTV